MGFDFQAVWKYDFWNMLIHWGRVMHICVSRLNIIGSDNGLSPGRRQAVIWTNAGILFIGPLGTNFSELLIEILTFSFKKMRLKVSSAKWRPFCLGLNVLTTKTGERCDLMLISILAADDLVFGLKNFIKPAYSWGIKTSFWTKTGPSHLGLNILFFHYTYIPVYLLSPVVVYSRAPCWGPECITFKSCHVKLKWKKGLFIFTW